MAVGDSMAIRDLLGLITRHVRNAGAETGMWAVKGAQIPSRRETVLVNHPATSIATLDSSTAPIGMPCTPRVRWRQSQGSMRPMGVVVVNEDAKHLVEIATVKDQ